MALKFSLENQIIACLLLGKLRARQRQAVTLRFSHDCSIFEIAKFLGVTWDEADRMIKDALARLKEQCLAHPHFSRALPTAEGGIA